MPSEDIRAAKERLRENVAKEFPGLGHIRTSAASDDIRAILADHERLIYANEQLAGDIRFMAKHANALSERRGAAEARVSALEGAARKMLWDGGGRPDHMSACERTMGDTHPCTCGAEAFRKILGHSPSALSPSSPAPVKEEVKAVAEGRTYTQAEVDSILRAAFAGDRGKQAEMRLNPSSPEARREEIVRMLAHCRRMAGHEFKLEGQGLFALLAACEAVLALKD